MNKLRTIRESKGISQLQLSRTSGVAAHIISNIETGKIFPYPNWRKNLAEALKVKEKILFPEVDKNENK